MLHTEFMSDFNRWHLFSAYHVLGATTPTVFQPCPLLRNLSLNFWDTVLFYISWSPPDSYFPFSLPGSTSVHTIRDTEIEWRSSHVISESQEWGVAHLNCLRHPKILRRHVCLVDSPFWLVYVDSFRFSSLLSPPLPPLPLLPLSFSFFHSLLNSQFHFS